MPLLRRHRLDAGIELRVALQQTLARNGKALAHRSNAGDDILAHGCQLVVELLHHRVVVGSGTLHTHTLEQQRVVLADKRSKRRIGDTDVSRNKAETLGIVLEEIVDIFHEVQLRLYTCQLFLLVAVCPKVNLRLLAQVGNVVLALIRRHGIFRLTQLGGNDSQALVDKRCRVGGDNVLIDHCVEVVLLDEFAEQRHITLRHIRSGGQVDDVRLLFLQRNLHLGAIGIDYRQLWGTRNTEYGIFFVFDRLILHDTERTNTCLYRLGEGSDLGRGTTEMPLFHLNFITTVLKQIHRNGIAAGFLCLGCQLDRHYGECALRELAYPACTHFHITALPEVEGFERLVHQVARRKDNHFVFCQTVATEIEQRERLQLPHQLVFVLLAQHNRRIGSKPRRGAQHIDGTKP